MPTHHIFYDEIIISGNGLFEFENGTVLLETRDSIYITKRIAHRTYNPGPDLYVAITAITPPSF